MTDSTPATAAHQCSGYKRGQRCSARAEYLVLVSCACHGSFRHATCATCTAAARSGAFRCTDGRQPNVVIRARSL